MLNNWIISKKFTFEAAHQLPSHQGKCSRLHGHSWVCWVYVSGDALKTEGSETDMVMDYGTIKAVVKPLLDNYLDHYFLNETTQLENPTSERIAQWIFDRIEAELPGLVAVRVDETCTAHCVYSRRNGDRERRNTADATDTGDNIGIIGGILGIGSPTFIVG